MHIRLRQSLLAVLACLAPTLALASTPPGPDRTLEVMQPRGAQAPEIESFKVNTTIMPGFSLTRVEQVYRNVEPRLMEARYTFPIPWRAAVSDFSMWVNGKEVRGEVVERKKAKRIYESIVNRKRDPGLLEVASHRYFSLRVYPIPPRGTMRFQISYVQPIDRDGGYATYVFPLATAARQGKFTPKQFSVQVDLAPGAPIAEAYSTSHEKQTMGVRYGKDVYRFSMEQQDVALDRDFVLTYRLDGDRTGLSSMAYRAGSGAGHAFFALTPGQALTGPPRPVNYIFLLDASGSMGKGNLLPAGGEALRWFLDRMSPESRFGLIAFNVMPKVFGDGLQEPTGDNRAAALQFLEGLQARGGTDFLPALRQALALAGAADADRDTAIVVISDGRVSGAEANIDRHLQLLDGGRGARVFSLGIGNDVNRPLLEALARETGGFARYVSSAGDLRAGLVSLKTKIVSPAITDLRMTFEGGGVTDVVPGRLPALHAGSQLIVAARYARPGKATVTIEGRAAGKAVKMTQVVELPASDEDKPELERGWAAYRVAEVLALMGVGQVSADAGRKEVTALGLEYGLVTPFTSYLVLESEAEYAQHGIGDRTRTRVARERAAQARRAQALDAARASGQPQEFGMGRKERVQPRGGGGSVFGGGGGGSPTLPFFLALLALVGLGRRR